MLYICSYLTGPKERLFEFESERERERERETFAPETLTRRVGPRVGRRASVEAVEGSPLLDLLLVEHLIEWLRLLGPLPLAAGRWRMSPRARCLPASLAAVSPPSVFVARFRPH